MALVREIALKIGHVSGESTNIKLSPITEAESTGLKARVKAINSGTVEVDGETKTVNYQPFLLSKSGSSATTILGATYTETESTRVYTRSAV